MDQYTGLSFNPRALLPVGILGGALSKLPFDFSASISTNTSQSITKNGIAQTVANMLITPYSVSIPIPRYRSCVAVEPAMDYPNQSKGIYICGPEKLNFVAVEEYFNAAQDVDIHADTSIQAVNMLLRGRRDLGVYFRSIHRITNLLREDQSNITDSLRISKQLYSRLPAPIPGVLFYPMVPAPTLVALGNPKTPKAPTLWDNVQDVVAKVFSSEQPDYEN